MLGLKEEVIDIPYNLIANAHLEKGVFSSSVIFTAPGLFNANIGNRIPGIKRLGVGEHGENGEIDAIPKIKGDNLIEIIRNGIMQIRANPLTGYNTTGTRNANTTRVEGVKSSVVEELEKLADLKQKGIISEEEFIKMKAKILKND